MGKSPLARRRVESATQRRHNMNSTPSMSAKYVTHPSAIGLRRAPPLPCCRGFRDHLFARATMWIHVTAPARIGTACDRYFGTAFLIGQVESKRLHLVLVP